MTLGTASDPEVTSGRARFVRELAEATPTPASQIILKVRKFPADCVSRARNDASRWLNDFSEHGPLQLESIRTVSDEDKYVAVVSYWSTGAPPISREQEF